MNEMPSSSDQPPDTSLHLNAETVQSVVEHMNSDHAEACLHIVKAFSEHGNAAVHAQLIDMDRAGLLFTIQTLPDHELASHQNVRINFPKSLRTEAQIRGALVGLTRQARQKLADQRLLRS